MEYFATLLFGRRGAASDLIWTMFTFALGFLATNVLAFFNYAGSVAIYLGEIGVFILSRVDQLRDYLGLGVFDVSALVLIVAAVWLTARLINDAYRMLLLFLHNLSYWIGKVYIWLYARDTAAVGTLASHDYREVLGSIIADEGAFNRGRILTEMNGMPLGTVQVYVEMDTALQFAGHATFVGDCFVTCSHVVRLSADRKVFVKTLTSKAVETRVTSNAPGMDYAELYAGYIPSVLGVKKAPIKWVSEGPISVCTYDAEKNKYFISSSYPEKQLYNEEHGFSWMTLLTQSYTRQGDSGLGVYQHGALIAFTKGGVNAIERNVHIIPVPRMVDIISKLRIKRTVVGAGVFTAPALAPVVSNETPRTGQADEDRNREAKEALEDIEFQEDLKRAREFADEEREEKERRMRGEHEDWQGFREKKSTGEPNSHIFKSAKGNKSWADIEDENSFLFNEKIFLESLVEKDGLVEKCPAPVSGAVEVAHQSPTPPPLETPTLEISSRECESVIPNKAPVDCSQPSVGPLPVPDTKHETAAVMSLSNTSSKSARKKAKLLQKLLKSLATNASSDPPPSVNTPETTTTQLKSALIGTQPDGLSQ